MTATNQKPKGFLAYVKDFKSIGGLIGKGALAAPILSLIFNVGPPWPSRITAPILTSLVQLLILAYIFQFWTPLSNKRKGRRMKFSVVALALGFLLYFWLFSSFVLDAPDAGHRDVKGFLYTAAAESVISDTYPEGEALKGAAYDTTRIWEPWTVNLMRLLVLVSWLFFFASVSVYFATFVLMRENRKARAQRVV